MVARDARNALRAGNNHEWYKVSQANVAKRWGLTAKEIKYDAVTNVNGVHDLDLWFRDIKVPENTKKSNTILKNKNTISGRHSDGKRIKPKDAKRNTYKTKDGKIKEYSTHKREENSESSLAHKELDDMFNSCKSKGEYLEKLNEWADKLLMQTEKDNADNIISRGRDALPECMRLSKK